jgi:hypothetical protein
LTESSDNQETVEREPFDIRDPSEDRVVDDVHSTDDQVEEEVESEAETEEVEAKDEPKAKEEPKFELGDIDQYLDTDLAKAVSSMIGQLKGQIDELKKSSVKPERAPAVSEFFANHSEIFGSDAPSPAQKKNRESIREQMDILKAGYKAAGKKAPDVQSLFEKALRSEFPDAAASNDRKQVVSKVQNRERKMILRPTSRHAESSDARSRATEAVAKRMRELGY